MHLTEKESLTSGEPNQMNQAAKPLHTQTHNGATPMRVGTDGTVARERRAGFYSNGGYGCTGLRRIGETRTHSKERADATSMVDVDAPGAEIFGGTKPSKSPVPYNPDPRVADYESAEEVMELFLNA